MNRIERFDGIAVCTLEGDIVYSNIHIIRSAIDPHLDGSLKGMIIDLSRVTYLDSVGLSLFMRCHAHMAQAKGKCIFVGLSGNVERVFKLMELNSLLTVVPTVEEAKRLLE